MHGKGSAEATSKRKWARILLLTAGGLFAIWIAVMMAYGIKLSDSEMNGIVGLFRAGQMELADKTVICCEKKAPVYLVKRSGGSAEDWAALGITRLFWEGGMPQDGPWLGHAFLEDELYTFYGGAFTSRYIRLVFNKAEQEDTHRIIYNDIARRCLTDYRCEGPVDGQSTFDELNITMDERSDLALTLEELYGVPVPDEALENFVTLEDMVGYIEDRL